IIPPNPVGLDRLKKSRCPSADQVGLPTIPSPALLSLTADASAKRLTQISLGGPSRSVHVNATAAPSGEMAGYVSYPCCDVSGKECRDCRSGSLFVRLPSDSHATSPATTIVAAATYGHRRSMRGGGAASPMAASFCAISAELPRAAGS